MVLTACAGATEAKLTASDGAAYDGFGYSVSISGDYAIMGALGGGDSYNSGAAYIFKRNGTGWDQQAKITASDGTAGDRFGYYSVSISGDYAIVGARGDDDNGNDSGSAYIYKRNGTTWSEQVKIMASDGTEHDGFGWSVFVSGDYTIVGTIGDDDSGSAYIYKRNGTTWGEQAKITASDGAASDYFGWSVFASGDYAIVGACGDNNNGRNSGSAYIYKSDGTTWIQQAKIMASDGAAGDYAIVGAWGDDDNGSWSGSAHIYKRDGTTWSQQAKIMASDGAVEGYFGGSVSISGDYAIVGARHADGYSSSSGSVYVFNRDETSWNQQAKIMASDGAVEDGFGESVFISGDYAIVGAPYDDDNGAGSGSAYIYDIQTTEPPITGDLNGDDLLTPADAVIALKMAAGSCDPTDAADVSDDGVVNSLDALLIMRAAADLIAL